MVMVMVMVFGDSAQSSGRVSFPHIYPSTSMCLHMPDFHPITPKTLPARNEGEDGEDRDKRKWRKKETT